MEISRLEGARDEAGRTKEGAQVVCKGSASYWM